MVPSCARCHAPVPSIASFCPACGATVTPVDTAPEDLRPTAPALRLLLDEGALRHFLQGTRCALRFTVESTAPLREVSLHARLSDGAALQPATTTATPAALTLWLVPELAGFHALSGLVRVVTAEGQPHHARFDDLQFRVGAPGEGPRVSVVNIDQSAARVVDNSRSQFHPGDGPERGGLVQGGAWHEVALRPISASEAAARFPAAVIAPPPSTQTPPAVPRSSGPARFAIRAEGGSYQVTGVLTTGDLATIYEGRRDSDGAPVIVKLVDDEADNDLMANEVAALALLCAEESPQRKHLPVVLDRFHTRDQRLGTIFERIDGYDLSEVRRRLPGGLPARHMIWLMRRCLSVLGHAHARGVLHGNVDPQHILVRASDHNVWLIDWCYAIVNPARTGKGFTCLNEVYSPPEVAARQPPLPSSDLYALGKSIFFVLGGDPTQKTLPPDLDERLQRFLQYCVLESPLSRAGDAWEAYRQLDRLRADLYGPHQFVELYL